MFFRRCIEPLKTLGMPNALELVLVNTTAPGKCFSKSITLLEPWIGPDRNSVVICQRDPNTSS